MKTQDEITKEWNALAGDWDDLATASPNNPNAVLFRRHVRPFVDNWWETETETRRRTSTRASSSTTSARQEEVDGVEAGSGDRNIGGSEEQEYDVTTPTATTTTSGRSRPAAVLRIVDFGCGTGIMIQHIMRHVEKLNNESMKQQQQQQEQPEDPDNEDASSPSPTSGLDIQVLAIDASEQMIDMVCDKSMSCEWGDDVVKLVCTTIARLPPLVVGAGDGAAAVEDDETQHHEDAFRTLKEWVGTADAVVACCALSCVPRDDVPKTVQQLTSLLRPNGDGQLLHCEWCEGDVDDDGDNEEKEDDDVEATPGNGAATTTARMPAGSWRAPWMQGVVSAREARRLVNATPGLELVSMEVVQRSEEGIGGGTGTGRSLLFGVARTRSTC